jgi:hypothetical protein
MAAMNDDIIYPHLTPLDDRYPSPGDLYRSAGDLPAGQFDLLAAAWAENALSEDNLAEIEVIFAADKSKEVYAGSFRQLRLVPCDDRWEGLNELLRTTPATRTIRRILVISVASAALLFALFTLKPFAEKQVGLTSPASSPEVAVISDSKEPATLSLGNKTEVTASAGTAPEVKENSNVQDPADQESPVKENPVTMIAAAEIPVLTPVVSSLQLRPVSFKVSPQTKDIPDDENWIVRGIARLSGAPAKGKKPVDAYAVAGAFFKGVNSVLGTEIELDKTVNKNGEPVAVSFSSSLLSFKAPIKKNSQGL